MPRLDVCAAAPLASESSAALESQQMTESEPVYSPASGMVVIAARRANNSTRVLEQSCPAATFSSSSFPVSNMIGFDCASPDWLRDAAYTSFAHAEVEVNTSYSLPGRDGVSWPGLHDGLGGVSLGEGFIAGAAPSGSPQTAGHSGVHCFLEWVPSWQRGGKRFHTVSKGLAPDSDRC